MPVKQKKDSIGSYYQYGNHGKKYYYKANDPVSRHTAKNKALMQQKAAHVSKLK
jgi:hypothetical protein